MAHFEATAGTVDVSPDRPVTLSGNTHPDRAIGRVDDPVEWQAVKLSGNGAPVFIISGDFLSASAAMRTVAEAALPDVPPENILLTATHTHTAPAIDRQLPVLGRVDEAYFAEAATKLTGLLHELASGKPEKANLRYAKGHYDGVVSRRRMAWRPRPPFRTMAMLPNEAAPIDDTIHLVRLERPDGSPIAIIWSWACHPTCYPDRLAISADFPGFVRRKLRQHYPDLPIVFLQGFAGDVRPKLYEQGNALKARLKRLVYGKAFGPVRADKWNAWASGLADAVIEADTLAIEAAAQEPAAAASQRSVTDLSALQDQSVPDRGLVVQKIGLTKGLSLFALGCEPVTGVADYCHGADGETIIPVGYVDHIYGYLPTERQLAEGGYEAEGFRRNFSLPGRYHSDLGSRIARILGKTL